MLPTRLIFFFALICLTNSSPPLKTAADYEVAEFKRIISSEGWKSAISIFFKLPHGSEEPVNKVFKDRPIINKHDASLILSNVYEKLLGYLNINYRLMSYRCNIHKNDVHKLMNFLTISKAILKFEPLISCMAKALKNLNCDNKNIAFNNLNKSLNIIKDIKKIEKKERSYELINSIFEKYCNNNDTPLTIQNSDTTDSHIPDNFIDKYIEKVRKLEKNSIFDPNHADFPKTVKEGVTMFCVNFGFKE